MRTTDDDKMLVTLTAAELRHLVREAVQNICAPTQSAREFLTAKQLAVRLGVCTRSIKTMVSRDELPTHQVGPRLVRFVWCEVEHWLLARGKNLDASTARLTRRHLRPVTS